MPTRDIDVFLFCTIIRKQYNLDKTAVKAAVGKMIDYPHLSDAHVDAIISQRPSTKAHVKALRDKGFSPGFIADYLNIKPSTVSYHLSTPDQQGYINRTIMHLQRGDAYSTFYD